MSFFLPSAMGAGISICLRRMRREKFFSNNKNHQAVGVDIFRTPSKSRHVSVPISGCSCYWWFEAMPPLDYWLRRPWNPTSKVPLHEWLSTAKHSMQKPRMDMLGNVVVPQQAFLGFSVLIRLMRGEFQWPSFPGKLFGPILEKRLFYVRWTKKYFHCLSSFVSQTLCHLYNISVPVSREGRPNSSN